MSQDYIALEWVKGEIEETLQQAQQALEAYVENPQDKSRLKFCLSYLHQIHGTLQMVEFYGAALLAEEMESVAAALTTGALKSEREGLEILMQAIIQLPHYLEHVKVGRRDLPVVLLPILNELRSARGEAFLSETSLFNPVIRYNAPLSPKQAQAIGTADFAQWARKVRQMLQTATLQLLQNKQADVAKQYLNKAFARLHKTLGHTPQGIVWLPALAFSEWLQKQQHLPSSAKQLLRQLDHLLKATIEDGVAAINQPAPAELLKNLLFYVARTDVQGEAIRQVQEQFGLRQALPTEEEIQQERTALSGPDRATVGHVLGALVEEIAALKDRFDLLVRSDDERTGALQELTGSMKQIADTMGMLGLGMPRKVMQEQQSAVGSMLETGSVTDDALLDVAGALLYIEATLSGMQREGDLNARVGTSALSDAQKAVLREARNVLEQVKDSVVAYIANQWAVTELADVPAQLHSIEGSLNMVPLPRVAGILRHAAAFVQQQLIDGGHKPEWSVLDTFADVLSGVEYFLERYSDNPRAAGDDLLQRSEKSLHQLPLASPLPVAAEPDAAAEVEAADELTEPFVEISLDGGENLGQAGYSEFDAEVGPDEEEVMLTAAAPEPAALDAGFEAAPETEPEAEPESELVSDALSEPAVVPATAPVMAAADDDDDLIDDEIIEIFLEEAEEVTETLNEFWPQFKADQGDKEAMTTVRRAFHTLKGSGRMVKAATIGELAWSIENMFNRVLDNTIVITPELIGLVDHVITLLPGLIDDFRNQRAAGVNTQPLMDYAFALAAGEAVGPLSDITGTAPQSAAAESVAATTGSSSAEDSADEDDSLLEVFEGEARSHLQTLDEFVQVSRETDYLNPLSDNLQRALHTLKGSAHMAGITAIAEVASPLEKLIKELRAYQVNNSADVVDALASGSQLIGNALGDRIAMQAPALRGSADYLADLMALEHELLEHTQVSSEERRGPNPQAISRFLAQGMDSLLDADELLQQWQQQQDPAVLHGLRRDLQDVAAGAAEAEVPHIKLLAEVLNELYQRIEDEQASPEEGLLALASDAHEEMLTLMDCLAAGQETQRPEALLERIRSWQFVHTTAVIPAADDTAEDDKAEDSHSEFVTILGDDLIAADTGEEIDFSDIPLVAPEPADEDELALTDTWDAEELVPDTTPVAAPEWLIEDSAGSLAEDIQPDEFVSDIELAAEDSSAAAATVATASVSADDDGIDDEILEIFLEEAQEISESVETALLRWRDNPDDLLQVAQLQRELHTLKGGARMAEISAVADLCHELETLYENISDGRLGIQPAIFDLLDRAHDELGMQLDAVRAAQAPERADAMMAEIRRFLQGQAYAEVPDYIDDEAATETAPAAVAAETLHVEALDESDREILEIFLEEANELNEALDRALHDWEQEPDERAGPEEAQRVLHTLKGGARLAGLVRIGDLAHDFETDILRAQQGHISRDAAFFQGAYQRQDELIRLVDQVATALQGDGLVVLGEASLTLAPQPQMQSPATPAAAEPAKEQEVRQEVQQENPAASTNVVPLRPAAPVTASKAPQPKAQQQARNKAPQELVKVSADLLDSLVNLAGETSIGRGRLEQQVTDFAHTLDEMDMTLDRLRDQLRRLDMETEAQVLFRQERHGPEYEDFDPLEMDRYSTIQQLSRALVESASDLLDLKETLSNKTRDAETLLLQQSRVNTELQEGLMKTRMVPFQRLVPRLRRIVRQVSLELDKQVELRVYNADGEMDRTILERMISPLEHMVRNAVDHGIETREQRASAGKPDVGNIDLEISRDGGDVLITMTDDGRGINLAAVRKKAIERGLMSDENELPNQEVLQFILQAGFSTAEAITQISGRGVGMDVVASEIKQMGGSVEIQSEAGVGTRFIVRLPFTVSVNRALMVKVGDDLYAVPLNNIQGIVRVPVGQMQALYEQPQAERKYSYAGTDYRIEYLGVMLENEASPKFSAQTMPLPVLLVRGTTPFALQVDSLLGSREIVVKTLGPQFAGVMGVSGGTILGDGSVVIILDLPAMIRTQSSLEYQQAKLLDHQEAERRHELESRLPRILVVDDSVTVRKVTTRLLERNGMEVFTAKDGVDAMATLQDHKPDLMLLDIEMPRMDGFEVASLVRHDSRLKDIPIIMITSRTGDKHRERAMSIGVNEYLGKPFQEDILLSTMNRLLGREEH